MTSTLKMLAVCVIGLCMLLAILFGFAMMLNAHVPPPDPEPPAPAVRVEAGDNGFDFQIHAAP